jgi:hypothetical protein
MLFVIFRNGVELTVLFGYSPAIMDELSGFPESIRKPGDGPVSFAAATLRADQN